MEVFTLKLRVALAEHTWLHGETEENVELNGLHSGGNQRHPSA